MQEPVPGAIDGFEVLEYGFFAEPLLPTGYIPPRDGSPPLEAAQNVAICHAAGVDDLYLLLCTSDWGYVTYSFHDTIESAKRCPEMEFGRPVLGWNKRG